MRSKSSMWEFHILPNIWGLVLPNGPKRHTIEQKWDKNIKLRRFIQLKGYWGIPSPVLWKAMFCPIFKIKYTYRYKWKVNLHITRGDMQCQSSWSTKDLPQPIKIMSHGEITKKDKKENQNIASVCLSSSSWTETKAIYTFHPCQRDLQQNSSQ